MEIDALEPVQLGGITQWIRTRGTSAANPVLLLMQQGPGLPIINETRAWQQRLGLENDFTVIYWDQRGTGLSALPLGRQGRFEITPQLMVADTITLLELLRDRYGRKPFIAGFSFGATYAAQAAVLRPDLVAGIVATGMDIDVPLAEQHMYDWALATARQRGNQRAVRQLEKIGPPRTWTPGSSPPGPAGSPTSAASPSAPPGTACRGRWWPACCARRTTHPPRPCGPSVA